MILTISTRHQPATDLGYLLRKNPDRHQTFDVFGGVAHVFYPVATGERCTAALMIDVDPIDLVRRRGRGARTPAAGGIDQYVNDRMVTEDHRMVIATSNIAVDLADAESEAAAVRWWEELTGSGGEGMVIKPLEFVARGKHGMVQPAVKCRSGISEDHLRARVHAPR